MISFFAFEAPRPTTANVPFTDMFLEGRVLQLPRDAE
jgi:hypothetical protein